MFLQTVLPNRMRARLPLIALAAATIVNPALARSSVRVGYSDLNLETRAGSHVMLARLRSAAHRACGEAPVIQDLARFVAYGKCVDHSLSEAVAALDSPMVTAAYAGTEAARRTVATADAPR